MSKNINKVGLEAEFLLRDKDGKLMYPADHGFTTDEFCILGEFRGLPGETREETIANFIKEYYSVIYLAKNKKLTVDIQNGFEVIEPKFHAEILRKMGSKAVAQCRNIYDIDILSLSDAEIVDGKVISQKLSTGLHIHFSCENESKIIYQQQEYEAVNLPININNATATFELFRKKLIQPSNQTITATANKITKPVVEFIVKSLDTNILPGAKKNLPNLKYRNPGFYEHKAWGFEYRSLPFNKKVLDDIHNIVDYSFSLLENL